MCRIVTTILGGCLLSPLALSRRANSPRCTKCVDCSIAEAGNANILTTNSGERFKTYLKHTCSVSSVLEAAIRGGIDQARDSPTQWPEGAQGYADRFGSVMGQVAIRGTAEYAVERYLPRRSSDHTLRVAMFRLGKSAGRYIHGKERRRRASGIFSCPSCRTDSGQCCSEEFLVSGWLWHLRGLPRSWIQLRVRLHPQLHP